MAICRGVVSVGAWAPTDFWELLKGTPWAPTDVFGSKTIGHPQIEIPDYAKVQTALRVVIM